MILTFVAIPALLVVGVATALTMRAVLRARRAALAHAAEHERVDEEIRQVANRATRLLEVTTALSEARSVEEVTAVVLSKGLAVVEATRGVVVSLEGDRLRLLGTSGMSKALEAHLATITLQSDIPLVHALRKGEMISIESGEEFRERFGNTYQGLGDLGDMQTYLATPLIHAGETLGAMSLHFKEAGAIGASHRTFTLLLSQSAATALSRAPSYDAEREQCEKA